MFREATVHEMCNEPGFDSVEGMSMLNLRLLKVKIYEMLIHEIMLRIIRGRLMVYPSRRAPCVFGPHIYNICCSASSICRASYEWTEWRLNPPSRQNRSTTDASSAVSTNTSVSVVWSALGGTFDTCEVDVDEHLESCVEFLTWLSTTLYVRKEHALSV